VQVIGRTSWQAVGAIALLVTIGSCSKGSSGTATGTGSGGTPGSGNSSASGCDLTQINAALEKYSGSSPFKEPGPAFSIKKAKGKTIFNIQESSTNPFT